MGILGASWLLDLSVVLLAIITSVYLFYRKQFKFWSNLKIKYEEPSFPFGNVSGMSVTRSAGEVFQDLYNSSKGERFYGTWSLFKPILLIRDPELIKSVFVKDFVHFRDRGIYVNEKDDPLAAHLFSIGGPKWKRLRNKLSPTFTSGKMKSMFPILVECSKGFDNLLNEHANRGDVIEMKDIVARFTTDIISLCAFGIQTNCLKNPDAEFRQWGRKMFENTLSQIMRISFAFFAPKMAEIIKLTMVPKDVSKYFMKAIKDTMDYRETNGIVRNDFLDLVLQLKNKGRLTDEIETTNGATEKSDSTKFTFEEAAAQVFVFYIAGFETSSTALQFALYELALHPDMQDKTREEINRVLAKHKGNLSYEAIYEMDYVGRVIDESLRKYPPVAFLQRECNQDYQIPNTDITIPKGTLLVISPLGLQRDPQYFPEPEKFDPDRFTEEEKSKRHHYSYLPFGEGPRNCIGMRFGLMQSRVGLITLLSKYRFEVCKDTPVPMVLDPRMIVMSPKGGMYLKISKI